MPRNTQYQFVSTDASALVAKLTAGFEYITKRVLRPADPEKLFISWLADVLVQERAENNYTGNQNLPSRAEGPNLDALGELFYIRKRPEAQPAVCTMRFYVSEAQLSAVLIPEGTQVTDMSSTLIWETTADVYIEPGAIYADVMVQCQTAGIIGNDYEIGQINTIITPYDFFDHCENITKSDGGADKSSDDEYYELMRESQDAYSTAGPRGAYIYLAKSVSKDIIDVKAISPKETLSKTLTIYAGHAFYGGDNLMDSTLVVYPHDGTTPTEKDVDYSLTYEDNLLNIEILAGGSLASETEIDIVIDNVKDGYVNIYALMKDGTIASSTIKELILAACNDRDSRPLNDKVNTEDPDIVPYDITFTYYIPRNSTKSSAEIEVAVGNAVNKYIAWQCGALGRDITPEMLVFLLMSTGIKRPVITAPVFTHLNDGTDNTVPQIAEIRTVTITNGGYQDE